MSMENFTIKESFEDEDLGYVYLVKRKANKQIYTIKRVDISSLSDNVRALNEIEIASSIEHKNILGCYEAFYSEDRESLYIVMDYADQGNLEEKLKYRSDGFSEDTIWIWLIQVLEGLNYLHDSNIIHGNLKPRNIYFKEGNLLKIGDFRKSQILQMGMSKKKLGGAPYYRSPEMWNNERYDYKSDIWSLGCIIYKLCTLKHPFKLINTSTPSFEMENGIYDPIPDEYSSALEEIISLMLTVQPSERPSADELLSHKLIARRKYLVKDIKREVSEFVKKYERFDNIISPEKRNEKNLNPKPKKKPNFLLKNLQYQATQSRFRSSREFEKITKKPKQHIPKENIETKVDSNNSYPSQQNYNFQNRNTNRYDNKNQLKKQNGNTIYNPMANSTNIFGCDLISTKKAGIKKRVIDLDDVFNCNQVIQKGNTFNFIYDDHQLHSKPNQHQPFEQKLLNGILSNDQFLNEDQDFTFNPYPNKNKNIHLKVINLKPNQNQNYNDNNLLSSKNNCNQRIVIDANNGGMQVANYKNNQSNKNNYMIYYTDK